MNDKITEEQKEILYSCGTEVPGTSELLNEKRSGVYVTADKELPVFKSEHKFESGTGWPSFYDANLDNIILKEDRSHGMVRTEVVSKSGKILFVGTKKPIFFWLYLKTSLFLNTFL